MPTKYELNKETHDELCEVLEDAIQYVCDEHMLSGEAAWTIVQCFSTAKLAQLNGEID